MLRKRISEGKKGTETLPVLALHVVCHLFRSVQVGYCLRLLVDNSRTVALYAAIMGHVGQDYSLQLLPIDLVAL